jgi:large subunit ribosomal protein L29
MKASEIRELRDDELVLRLEELERRLFEIRAQSVTEKIADSCARRNVRRNIARIKTIMKERQLHNR